MTEADRLLLLATMWLVRAFDEAAGQSSRLGEIPGVIHLTSWPWTWRLAACR